MSKAEQQQSLDAIADRCGVARSTFILRDEDAVEMRPDRSTDFQHIDCALSGIRDLRGFKAVGFVGNETPFEDAK